MSSPHPFEGLADRFAAGRSRSQAKPKGETLWRIISAWNEEDIPVRPWLARGFLIRGCVTVVSGAGGAGKSSLMVAWSTSLSVGCSFGRFKCESVGPMRALTYNVEDDENEQRRRYSAFLGRLGLDPSALGDRLAIVGPSGVGTLFTAGPDGDPIVNTLVMDRLEEVIAEHKPDVVILDPFVELHDRDENENTAVREVMARLRALAVEHNMAVVVLHHTRKGASAPGDAESVRGAGSIVGAARVVLTVNAMSEDEAEELGIAKEQRRRYFRVDDAKSNYSGLMDVQWFQHETRMLKNGDGVACVWPWSPPNVWRDTPMPQINHILDLIDQGVAPGVLYSATKRGASAKRWVGTVVIREIGASEDQAKSMIDTWMRNGVLVEDTFVHPRFREEAKGVRVNATKRPS